MAVGDFRVRVNAAGNLGHVALILRCERRGETEVLRAYGHGEAMALRELYRRVRALLGVVQAAGELAVRMDSNDAK